MFAAAFWLDVSEPFRFILAGKAEKNQAHSYP